MPDTNQDFAAERQLLQDRYIERLKYEEYPGTAERELHRHWPEIHDSQCPTITKFLRLYTDPKNPKEQRWVKDPVAGKGTDGKTQAVYPGIYRLVSVNYDVALRGQPGVWQVLRFGFAQAWDWTEVQRTGGEQAAGNTQATDLAAGTALTASTGQDPARFIEVEFPNVDPSKMAAILAVAPCISKYVDALTVEGVSYGDGWHVLGVTPTYYAKDSAGSIRMILAKPQFVTKCIENMLGSARTDVYRIHRVPKYLVQTVLDAWAAKGKGRTSREEFNRGDNTSDLTLLAKSIEELQELNVVTEHNCDHTDTTDFYYNVQDPDTEPHRAIDHENYGVDGHTISVSLREQGDGTWDVVVTDRHTHYRDPDGNLDSRIIEKSAAGKTTERQQLGVVNDTVLDDISNPAQGIIFNRRVTFNNDCSKNVVTQKETPDDQVGSVYEDDGFHESDTLIHTEASAALPDPGTSADGTIRRVRSQETPSGNHHTEDETDTAKAVTEPQVTMQVEQDITTAIQRFHNQTAFPDITTFIEGTYSELVEARKTAYKKFTYTQSVQTSTEAYYPSAATCFFYDDVDGRTYVRLGFNVRQANINAALALFSNTAGTGGILLKGTHKISANPTNRNRDGTYDIVMIATPKVGPASNATDTDTDNSRYYFKENQAAWRWIIVQVFYTHNPTHRDSFLSGGNPMGYAKCQMQSGYSWTNSQWKNINGIYQCTRISVSDTLGGAEPSTPTPPS